MQFAALVNLSMALAATRSRRQKIGLIAGVLAAAPAGERGLVALWPAKSTAWTLVDYGFEGLLLVLGSFVVTSLVVLGRRFPKSAAAIALAGALFVVGLFVFEGE